MAAEQQVKPLYPLWPRQQQAMQFLGLGAYANQEPVDELLFGGQAGGAEVSNSGRARWSMITGG